MLANRGEARIIRGWRCLDGKTWRWIGRQGWLAFGEYPPSGFKSFDTAKTTQEDGKQLCVEAAEILGEDPNSPPWN
jgi:hypothetical protein